jgi:hypothetical protein
VVQSLMNEEALLQRGQMGVGKMASWIQLLQNLLLHSFCDTIPPSAPSKKSCFSFLDGMKPNPRDYPLRWVSFFFFFFPYAPDLSRSVLRKTQLPTPPSYLPKPHPPLPPLPVLELRRAPWCSAMLFDALPHLVKLHRVAAHETLQHSWCSSKDLPFPKGEQGARN